jgi:hypothetical protein
MCLYIVELTKQLDLKVADTGRVLLKPLICNGLTGKGFTHTTALDVVDVMKNTVSKCLDLKSLTAAYRLGHVIILAKQEEQTEETQWMASIKKLSPRDVKKIVLEKLTTDQRFVSLKQICRAPKKAKKRTCCATIAPTAAPTTPTATATTSNPLVSDMGDSSGEVAIRGPLKRQRLAPDDEDEKPKAILRAVLRTSLHFPALLEKYCIDEGLLPKDDEVFAYIEKTLGEL